MEHVTTGSPENPNLGWRRAGQAAESQPVSRQAGGTDSRPAVALSSHGTLHSPVRCWSRLPADAGGVGAVKLMTRVCGETTAGVSQGGRGRKDE